MEENYLMNYNTTTGEIKGFYLKSIHGDNIPTPNIEITTEKHDFYMNNNGQYRLNLTTLEDELIPMMIADVKQNKINEIKEAYNIALTSGFTSSAVGTSIVYDYGETSQTKFMKLLMTMNAVLLTYPTTVFAKDSSPVSYTQEQLTQLFKDLTVFEMALETKLHTYINDINSATTIDAVNAIIWS